MGEATEGLQTIKNYAMGMNTTSYAIVAYFSAAILGISLIYVVWALASHQQGSYKYLISWFIGLIFTLIFLLK
ncbi:hypothetical protein [Bacteroides pyogenes]|jgi:hypothetical protein|uniref:Uncharacterized protein n=1 Tax=Bacteroides pyogenes TaxID=310300 RepID=A0A5D3EAF4_9BACE|nr:hypothetical protein [Bacteroides pyogenes]TYK32829.1 hypothetical protein FNJ60_10490 [Bacteroides pyogenes]